MKVTFLKDPTPYAAVNEMLERVQTAVSHILTTQLIGLYLDGSLALGDFDEATSDIDLLVLTADFLPDETIAKLAAMHAQLGKSGSKWGYEMEVSYVPLAVLNELPKQEQTFALPRIERGETLVVEPHEMDWVLHGHILREHGITLFGPPIQTLLDPISPEQIRQATRDLFNFWWRPMADNPQNLQHTGYRVYAILTMWRMLYTMRHGTVVSKPAAARWAMAELDERWRELAQTAVSWRGEPVENLEETIALIRYVGSAVRD